MRRWPLVAAVGWIGSAFFLAGTGARADDGDAKGKVDGDLFGLTKVVRLQLEITADEYQALQPAPLAFGAPPPAPRPKKPGARESERNLFGVEFPWVRGTLREDGRAY